MVKNGNRIQEEKTEHVSAAGRVREASDRNYLERMELRRRDLGGLILTFVTVKGSCS